jgi:bifunctional enzyme CysN/CysC
MSSIAETLGKRGALRFLTCGSVDDGKSTLIGRLLHDSASLFDDQLKILSEDSRRFGTIGDELDLALLLDGLDAEREQGITIDVAWRFFSTARRAFAVADTPGHVEYTRNMASGASNADLAILLVDAEKGIVEQTRRHAAIVSLLGIRHVVLAVNKVDLINFEGMQFHDIERAFTVVSKSMDFLSRVCIPISARLGDNVVARSNRTRWYAGPVLLDYLESIDVSSTELEKPFRFPVQWVNRPDSAFRGFAGTVASGQVSVGDSIVVANSGRESEVSRIVTFDRDILTAQAGRAISLVLANEVDIVRGDVLTAPRDRPMLTRRLTADLLWMGQLPVEAGTQVLLKTNASAVPARMPTRSLAMNTIGRVELDTSAVIAVDKYRDNRRTGAFILIDRSHADTLGAGMVVGTRDRATNVHHQAEFVTPTVREKIKGQKAVVVWLTGLPASGKSTIANILELKLVAAGRHAALLDGDNLRQGINADLGFAAEDRSENVRRVAEIAKLMTDAGLIAIVALVSPFRADRDRAMTLLKEGQFLEIFIDAPSDLCRARDTKGLYAKAGAGKISNFTGRDQAYEEPLSPALVLKTGEMPAEAAADRLFALVLERSQSVA